MPSPAKAPSQSSRKFAWLAGVVVALCLLWTAGWFFFAAKIETHLPAVLAQIAGPGADAECAESDIRGYPFRFGLFCNTVAYTNTADGITATAGAFRSAAQFYRPGHAVAEIDGPLALTQSGLALRADWQLLKASVRAASDGIERGSMDAQAISFDIDGPELTQRLSLQADRMTVHARRNETDLDIAAYGENLRNGIIAGLTAKAFTLEATLPGRSRLLEFPFTPLTGPFDAQLHRMAIEFDESSALEITGPIQIDADGQITGDLELTVRNLQKFSELAARFNPESAELLDQVGPLVAALDMKPGDDAVTLPLTVRNNMVSLGMFPLGELPSF